ncbi:conserved hypothetical protein [Leishmania infantum JPCM5]|uniref:Uncharacterized protein n=2 Tax=Leishmania infantum TaxID=5671 RepID=A4IAJ2_LEIIN|nr:conserved hypothetical protein [Leishmania infantum JPCM5]CAC9541701.1 hypothetical_protein_-_conserved [Leishmania infantum]CAM71849.1 conserved hypothetical protein [Leishmania infantum JPCM5]SUZ45804.1 hypothetical_protein_-_conserved [Leishmania infantum]|eukprot:XP_001468761.1 conserved hypothetical protein [Leishmania infantum JPCM5]
MQSKVIALLTSRPLLTAAEAAMELGVAHGDLQPIFASVAASNKGVYTLLTGSVEEAADGSATAVVMRKADRLEEDTSSYALLSLTYPSNMSASSLPVRLHPCREASLRAYPLVARSDMEPRAAATAPPVAAGAPAATELTRTEDSKPAAASLSAATPVAPTIPPLAQDEPPRSTPTPATVTAPKKETAARTPSPKAALFDKMKEAAATKRPRTEKAQSKPPRQPAKPKKVAKTENTTSLAKLARASKRKSGGTPAATGAGAAPTSMRFLDDDDDATAHFSHSEGSTSHSEAIEKEEPPIFDVVEVPASNDEVIMCDDAPPLAFRPAAPLPSPPTPTPTKKGPEATKASSAAAAAEAGAAQCKLSTFFNAAVVEFQKAYVREMQTEMKVENGEFVCCDVPRYKHSATGEVISEDEYHQRTAAFVRSNSQDAAANTPNRKSAGASVESPPCPTAKQKTGSRGTGQKSVAQEETAATPAKTLHSFFKTSSA